tara:strand:- start:12 stop:1286 length:1275 start_codon:yes stop_codon:yes gene_type:complete
MTNTSLEYNSYEEFQSYTDYLKTLINRRAGDDCTKEYIDTSGNTIDCFGQIIKDASGNVVDSSGNIVYDATDVSGNTTTTTTTSNNNDDNDDNFSIILTYENLYVLFWIVSLYFILYSILSFFFRRESLGYVYDVIILLTILGIIIAYRLLTDTDEYKDDAEDRVDSFLSFFDNKYNIVFLVIALVMLYVLISIIKIPTDKENKPTIIIGLETLLMILLVLILFVQFFDEFVDVKLTDELRERLGIINPSNTITTNTTSQPDPVPAPIPVQGKEVFNIGGNHYTYSDAEAICKSFDSELADYDQIEQSYNNGGEWCNYGWSKNQMALFPTQKKTWDNLQDSPATKNNCGRPGINGGYMSNPALRFGVNCYGIKPSKRDIDYAPQGDRPYKSPQDKLIESKTEFWKQNKDKLRLNHYNSNEWSKY